MIILVVATKLQLTLGSPGHFERLLKVLLNRLRLHTEPLGLGRGDGTLFDGTVVLSSGVVESVVHGAGASDSLIRVFGKHRTLS